MPKFFRLALVVGLVALLFSLACAGPAGTQGERGPAGTQGERGLAGPTGPTGPGGPAGDRGPEGAMGPPGARGPAGAQGPAAPQPNANLLLDPPSVVSGKTFTINGSGFASEEAVAAVVLGVIPEEEVILGATITSTYGAFVITAKTTFAGPTGATTIKPGVYTILVTGDKKSSYSVPLRVLPVPPTPVPSTATPVPSTPTPEPVKPTPEPVKPTPTS